MSLFLLGIVACGGDDAGDAATDASDEVGVDAPADVSVDVAPEAAPRDASKDVAADTGAPRLTCKSDVDEPNESEILSTPLGTIDDCDGSGSDVAAVSSGTGDVDWMVFHGQDTFGCSVDPTLQIDAPGLRLCAFALCEKGTTTIQDCGSGTAATSPAGTHGCCTTSTMSMTLQIACSGSDDSAGIYIRVDQPDTNQCVPYDVTYHY
ncbi:MAG TPA: hypothetical protein VGH28_17775 [Polyangiaceae bacterium]